MSGRGRHVKLVNSLATAILRTHFLLAEEAIKELGDRKAHCFC